MTGPERSEIKELSDEVRRLVESLSKPKSKDWTERLSAVSSFLSTVVVAALGLYFTHASQKSENTRQKDFGDAQLSIQRSQTRIEELKALTSVAPLLASHDSAQRSVAVLLLAAVNDARSTRSSEGNTRALPANSGATTPPPPSRPAEEVSVSVIDRFIVRARDEKATEEQRITALRQIEQVAISTNASSSTRMRALEGASAVAVASGLPEGVREAASAVIARIQSVDPSRIATVIANAPLKRHVTEVIIHSTATPAKSYNGAQSILSIAKFAIGEMGWSKVQWHYLIAPDGTVWLGMPLDETAIHAGAHNNASVSVMLLLDGDVELPTVAQQRAFGEVMRDVRRKVGLASTDPNAALLHRELPRTPKTCPGKLITRELVDAWIAQS